MLYIMTLNAWHNDTSICNITMNYHTGHYYGVMRGFEWQ